tara:strand:- start:20234 stop:21511 length:1278 start_codon:yes stop_codon:yes gene_type:complete
MIILLVGSILLLAMFTSVSTYYTSTHFDQFNQSVVKQYNEKFQEEGIQIKFKSKKSLSLNQEDQYVITLYQTYFDENKIHVQLKEPVTFTIKQKCKVWPFYIDCQNKVKINTAHPFSINSKVWEQLNYQWNWQYTVITQRITSQLSVKPFKINYPKKIKFDDMKFFYESDRNLQYNTLNIYLDHVKLENKNYESIEFNNLHTELLFDMLKQQPWTTQLSLQVDEIHAYRISETLFRINELFLRYNVNEPPKKQVKLENLWTMKSLYISSESPVNFDDFSADIRVQGIHKQVAKLYSELGIYTENMNENKARTLLNTVNPTPILLQINQIKTGYNQVDMKLDGEVKFPAYIEKKIDGFEHYIDQIKGNLNLTFSKNIESIYPIMHTLLPIYEKEKVVTKTDLGNYQMKVKINKGHLLINKKIIGAL